MSCLRVCESGIVSSLERAMTKSGNAVRIGSGPATVKGATHVATRVRKPLERSGKVDAAAPSQETCPRCRRDRGGY